MKREMKTKNGFTLIELLAVIIILAIIALIATPIILDVVEDARKSAGLSESNMILSGINNYCATEEIKAQMNSSYIAICTSSMDKEDVPTMVNLGNAEILEIEYSDKLTWLKVKSNGYIYSLQDNVMVEADLDKPDVTYAVGDLLKVQVSDSETQNIYVLEVNGDEIVGILDRNLPGGTVAWISEEDYNLETGRDFFDDWQNSADILNQKLNEIGPITANKTLNERTSTWNRVNKKYLPSAEDILKLTEFYQKLSDKSNWQSEYDERLTMVRYVNCSSYQDCKDKLIESGYGDILLPEWIFTSEGSSTDYWTSTVVNYSVANDCGYAWYKFYAIPLLNYDLFVYSDAEIRPVIQISQSDIISKLEAP